MRVIGFDAGVTGALASIYASAYGTATFLMDLPIREDGRYRRIDAQRLSDWLRVQVDSADADGDPMRFICEDIHAIANGFTTMQSQASLVGSFEIIRACVNILGHELQLVNPRTWQKAYALDGKKKDKGAAARETAIRLYPGVAEALKRVRDHNRADALLIAHYGLMDARGLIPSSEKRATAKPVPRKPQGALL